MMMMMMMMVIMVVVMSIMAMMIMIDDDGWIDDWRQTHWLGAECTGWTPNEKATWPGAEWVRRSLLSKPQHHLAIVRTCKTDRLAGHVEEEP